MARNGDYQEKNRPILSILYVVAVIALVAALVLMYMNYRERRGEYQRLVKEASRSDMNLDIESRIQAAQVEEDAEEEPEAVAAVLRVRRADDDRRVRRQRMRINPRRKREAPVRHGGPRRKNQCRSQQSLHCYPPCQSLAVSR